MDKINITDYIDIPSIRLLMLEEPKLLLIFEVLCSHINDKLNNRKEVQLDTLIQKEREEIKKQKKEIEKQKKEKENKKKY